MLLLDRLRQSLDDIEQKGYRTESGELLTNGRAWHEVRERLCRLEAYAKTKDQPNA